MRFSLQSRISLCAIVLSLCCSLAVAQTKTIHVAPTGPADFHTIQQAVDAAPDGGTIILAPGTYRETIKIHQARLLLRGSSSDPAATVIVANHSTAELGHTLETATVSVYGDDFRAHDLTIQNDYNKTHDQVREGSQALALLLIGDRAVLSHVHLLANQDTLYVGSKNCGPDGKGDNSCLTARAYFTDCLIAGNVDFIYGPGKAVFDHCEIRSTPHPAGGFLTAQAKTYPAEDSGFVFNHCKLTAAPGVAKVYLGRPWRPYAEVVYLNTWMGAHIVPAGWLEWKGTHNLDTVFYAEFYSTGPGANPSARDPHSHQLTAAETKPFETNVFLAGTDDWDPTADLPN